MAFCTETNIRDVKRHSELCLELINTYRWFIDAYVLDFFIESHWDRIPVSWQLWLRSIGPRELAQWLDLHSTLTLPGPPPLSILALRASLSALSLRRAPLETPELIHRFLGLSGTPPDSWNTFQGEFTRQNRTGQTLLHVFRKHIKPKKQHEIARMAQIADLMAQKCGQNRNIIDIGSGMGHLARLLSYGHGFQVACVDIETDFTTSAQKFDRDLKTTLEKKSNANLKEFQLERPSHVTFRLEPQMRVAKLEEKLLDELSDLNHPKEPFLRYGVMGLHTCGDLGPLTIKLFVDSPSCEFLQSVGCCYMKLDQCYPLSRFLSEQPRSQFSYVNQELSCHALEMYIGKLEDEASTKLKTHCYRANLEAMISTQRPELRKSPLNTVSKAYNLDFQDYVGKATQGRGLDFGPSDFEVVDKNLDLWWEVVAFYSLRLAFAPIIETVQLLDRSIFLFENGHSSALLPIFEPLLSPRNHGFELDATLLETPDKASQVIQDYLKDIEKAFGTGEFQFPDIDPAWTWFNVQDPLSLSHLKGRIVVLDFFTYCCINCMHILPDLEKLETIFPSDQVLIVGVHSAKFENEKDDQNIRNAILRYGIHHPVVNDGQAKWWNTLQISCWPTLMILSPDLKPLKLFMGEGHFHQVRDFLFETIKYFQLPNPKHQPLPLPQLVSLGQKSSSTLRYPGKVSSSDQSLLISDTGHHRIAIVHPSGDVKTIIGSGTKGFQDGTLAEAQFASPQGSVFIGTSKIIVADTENHALRQIDLELGLVSTLCGTGFQGTDKIGGNQGREQPLASPWDLCLGSSPKAEDGTLDTVFIAMAGTHQIWGYALQDSVWWKGTSRRAGTCFALAGSGAEENRNTSYPNKAGFAQPSGLSFGSKQKVLYIADSESSSIRVLDVKTGTVKNVCGGSRDPSDLFAFGDQDGADARLQHPLGVALNEEQDQLYVADSYNHKIKVVSDLGNKKPICTTVTAIQGLDEPGGIHCQANRLIIADTNRHQILQFAMNGDHVEEIPIALLPRDETDSATTPSFKLKAKYDFREKHDISIHPSKSTIHLDVISSLSLGLEMNKEAPSHWKMQLPPGCASSQGLKGPFRGSCSLTLSMSGPQPEVGSIYVEVNAFLCHETNGACYSKSALIELKVSHCDEPKNHTDTIAVNIKF
eukprot:snap_masked-scaffold292_size219010-processed-gene-1.16 protein:Tk00323 transcript:snap_masked-scaffold292_size219010-processed-gene-1.16-mRNA-1 annotation:"nhl repeat-containing protein 2"